MMSENGLTTIPSAFSVRETIDRLEKIVTSKGLSVFVHVDHAAGAAQVGMALRPTELIIFGNAKGGTPLIGSLLKGVRRGRPREREEVVP
jgi:uncharacterized protein (DUF302 family)